MKNLLETYSESSKSLQISIESDKQPVSVDVEEIYSIWKDPPYFRKQPQQTFKPLAQISK